MRVHFNLQNIQSVEKNRTGTPQRMAADRGAKGADAAVALLRQRLHFVTSDTKRFQNDYSLDTIHKNLLHGSRMYAIMQTAQGNTTYKEAFL